MTFRFTTVVRGTLVSMICAKTLDLSITSLDESAAMTLMSNDTGELFLLSVVGYLKHNSFFPRALSLETICGGFQNLHEIWAVPLELGIAMWLLYRELGLSFLGPAVVAIVSTLCIIQISSYIGKAQKRWNEGIQTRIDVTATMLGSMKVSSALWVWLWVGRITETSLGCEDARFYTDCF